MYEIASPPGGTGNFSGNIWYAGGANKTATDPAPSIEVLVSKQPGGNPISVTCTDTSGHYAFSNIAVGFTYKLLVDIPGFQLISTYSINLTPLNFSFQHLNFLIDTSDTGRGIYRSAGTGIESNDYREFAINVFPNPFKNIVNIDYKLSKTSDIMIEIIDMDGRIIENIVNEKQNAGNYRYTFNRSARDMTSEVFIIKLTIDNNIYIKKVVRKK